MRTPRETPLFTIYVRHSKDCKHGDDETFTGCKCWKHIRWYAKGQQHSVPTHKQKWGEAVRVRDRMEAGYGDIAQAKPTVSDAIKTFIQSRKDERLSAGVVGKYERELDRLRVFLGSTGIVRLEAVTQVHLIDFRSTWENLYPASSTRQKVQERLKAFFRHCTDAYKLSHNPMAGLRSMKITSPPTMPLSSEEYTALLTATAQFRPPMNNRLHALVQLGRWSGLAVQDAVCLPRTSLRRDAHGHGLVITARAKNGNAVEVPIPSDVTTELENLPNSNPDYFFWMGRDPKTGTKSYQKAIRQLFKKAGIDNGDSNMKFHRLRDTFAVENLKKRISMEDVSQMLGHSSIKTTEKHYAQWVQGRQDVLNQAVIASWSN